MRSKFLQFMLVVAASFSNVLAQPSSSSPALSDAEIRDILAYRVDNQRQALGIVVGIVDPKGRRVVTYGSFDTTDKQPAGGDIVFDVGAITEVFTGLLLADMVQHHEVALTDPVAKYLPKSVKIPERGRQITLQDLAVHTSGLPRNPKNLNPKDPADPYADYTAKDLYQFLSSYRLERDVGSAWDYSNVGPGLLGHVLTLRSRKSYEALVRTRITEPLGMKSTGITKSPEIKSRLAAGHDAKLNLISNWNFQALAGAGALHSTANDLLSFLSAALGYSSSPLAPALEAMVKIRQPTSWNELENALGWQVCVLDGNEIVRKDGTTLGYANFGYSTFLGYDTRSRIGVVVMSNSSTLMGIDDIGLHLLDRRYALRGKDQKIISVDPKVFDGYVGSYQLSPIAVMTVARENNRLFANLTGQPKQEIFPQSDHNYFFRSFDAQLTFETDSQGQAGALILHYNGRHQRAKRIKGPSSPALN